MDCTRKSNDVADLSELPKPKKKEVKAGAWVFQNKPDEETSAIAKVYYETMQANFCSTPVIQGLEGHLSAAPSGTRATGTTPPATTPAGASCAPSRTRS